jgi:anti-sigma factor RsiW
MNAHLSDERLDAWIDGRLEAAERRVAEEHLAGCERCRRLRDALLAGRDALRDAFADEPAPAGLADRLRLALDREDEASRVGSSAPATRWRWRSLAPPLAASLALIAVGITAIWLRSGARSGEGPVDGAFADYQALRGVPLPLEVRARDAAEVEERWRQGGITFPSRVLDLGAMGIEVAGGDATRLGGRLAARSVYRGDGGLFLCWMFEGSVAALPPPAERRRNGSFEFLVYRRGATTVVFWQEGSVACALAGEGDPEAIIALAFAKAMAPAAAGA